ncbi:UPF0182 family protein [Myxosarcina sp. GI1]|uniref:UPF0182 family protein n=1 Tax=Myxosarcina sp. GI1 TaxID=1541065 RepID=UPI00068D3D23|nr:UPF0182 family protein [Myxosarcina sp. GI1]
MTKRLSRKILVIIPAIFGLWLIFQLVGRVFAEILWFEEVEYQSVLYTKWQTQGGLWLVFSSVSILFLWGNLWLTSRLQWRWLAQKEWYENGISYTSKDSRQLIDKLNNPPSYRSYLANLQRNNNLITKTNTPKFKLSLLLPLAIIAALAIATMLLHYGNTALDVWQSNYRLPKVALALKPPADISPLENLRNFIWLYLKQLSVIIFIALLLIWQSKYLSWAIAGLISIVFGFIWAGNWTLLLKFFKPTLLGVLDPQFNRDISFYIFRFPIWQLLETWLLGLFGCGLAICFLVYLLSANSLSEGKFPGFSRPQMRHLSFLAAGLMLSLAVHHWLGRYRLLYASRGVVYGAGYTDIKIQLPVENILTLVSLAIAIWFLIKAFTGYSLPKILKQRFSKIILIAIPLATYLLILLIGNLGSEVVQRLAVQPNELDAERPYIERSIALTRQGFNLDAIEARTFNPQGDLTARDIAENDLTIENIRLWDTRPILQTNRQLQRIRPYYQFPDADIDRYLLDERNVETGEVVNNYKQQVIIAARELDYETVPDRAKTWVNQHLVYTHGYGFTLSPVNEVDDGGLPFYFVRDIGAGTEEEGDLSVSNKAIEQNIPIGKPRIYYGELTNPYIMTSTQVRELDYPSGEDNVYNTYDGKGGIALNNYGRRILFSQYLRDWQMLFTRNFTSQTRLLFRRNIKQRVKAIAPFLNFDRDPYLVVAETSNPEDKSEANYLYWIIDAYTTSDRYPYSDPGKNNFNYIRNSVKIVVDAYNGNVDFYIAEPSDPIIQTWDRVFPQLFKPLSAMPADLRRHIRYPEDLFAIQSERLLTYHMLDPRVFYNREDQWQIPQEIYGTEAQPINPYYLIMKLPTATNEEFILLHPYTPVSRPNLIAWLAARSDNANYGRLLLYQFPKQKLVYGPNQIEALINQDPVISQQISLWNREGSRVVQGNLLIIPIEQSLLYVEPLYLEAERNSLPILARVIVVYESQIVMAETLDSALDAIFTQGDSEGAIIRPLNDLTPDASELEVEGEAGNNEQ